MTIIDKYRLLPTSLRIIKMLHGFIHYRKVCGAQFDLFLQTFKCILMLDPWYKAPFSSECLDMQLIHINIIITIILYPSLSLLSTWSFKIWQHRDILMQALSWAIFEGPIFQQTLPVISGDGIRFCYILADILCSIACSYYHGDNKVYSLLRDPLNNHAISMYPNNADSWLIIGNIHFCLGTEEPRHNEVRMTVRWYGHTYIIC